MGALGRALIGYPPPTPATSATNTGQPAAAPAQAQPDPTQDATAPQQILMVGPDGSTAYIPPDKVSANEANGAEVGIRMVGPDGSKAVIPFSKQDVNQQNGAKWDSTSPDNDTAKAFLTQRSVSQSRSSTQGKAVVTGPDGLPMFMDVPEGHEASTEAANQKGTATGAAIGVGTLATGGLGAALAAPGIITEEVATGLLDEFGEPITREIVKQGPSLLGKGFQATAQWAAAHPTTAKAIIEIAGVTGAVKIWNKLAKLNQEFGGK